MPTSLTGSLISATYPQLLHVDDGPSAEPKIVYSATGVATSLRVGISSGGFDNILMDGNTISTTVTDGNLVLSPNGTGNIQLSSVVIDGGTVSNITDLAVADGGTGASDAAGARTNLELGTLSTQDADNVSITGGSITDVVFTGSFSGITSITSNEFLAVEQFGFTTGNGGAVTQATSRTTGVTLNAPCGQITLVADDIPGLNSQEFTLTNSYIAATDVVMVSFASGLTSAQYDVTVTATAAGSCKISVHNVNNTATNVDSPVINFVIIKSVTS